MSAERLVCTIAPVEAILRLAAQYPVFPCRRTPEEIVLRGERKLMKAKSPLIAGGLHKATQDPERIRAWWAQWPDALVGVPTGTTTGLVVVDYDADKIDDAANAWVKDYSAELMSTRAHGTISGGRHYLFRAAPGLEYRNGVCLTLAGEKRNGIDLRAEGGYIIWWPLHGGNAVGQIAPLPAGLVDEQRIEKRELPPLPEATPEAWAKDRQLVADALAYLDPSDYGEWSRAGLAIHLASGGSDDGFALWHAWSAGEITGDCPPNYSGINDCRYHWSSYRHDKERTKLVTLGSIFERAKDRGYVTRGGQPWPETPPIESYADEERAAIQAESEAAIAEQSKPGPRRPMQWTALETQTPPVRSWRVSHWLTSGPTLMAGSGGVGKTLLAQTIGTALALGRSFIDDVHEPAKVLMWACEDDHDELWRRQVAICKFFDVPLSALEGRLIIEPRLGLENTLYSLAFGTPIWTPLREELAAQVKDYGADVLFLDNIGQTFGGKENERHHVTQFLNGLAGLVDSAVVMGHPAKTADSEFSGSTAWENGVRMRWYMGYRLPDQEPEEGAEEDPNIRFLAKRKANYTERDFRKLEFRDGLFVPEVKGPGEGFSARWGGAASRAESAKDCILHALTEITKVGIRVTDGPTSPDYLPKKMRAMKLAGDYSPKELSSALAQLRLSGLITEQQVGKLANRMPKMGLVIA